MDFAEYAKMIKDVPFTEGLEYKLAVYWLHPEILPLGVVSLGENVPAVVRIPERVTNKYGRKVPVITVGGNAFAGQGRVTDIVLPPTVDRLPAGAFAGCEGLKRITIPKKIRTIWEGTFSGCDQLEDVYYEGSIEEWKNVNITHHRHEIEFGELIPGTPIQEIKSERLIHLPGNDALLTANIHFRCVLSDLTYDPGFQLTADGKDVTDLFRTF